MDKTKLDKLIEDFKNKKLIDVEALKALRNECVISVKGIKKQYIEINSVHVKDLGDLIRKDERKKIANKVDTKHILKVLNEANDKSRRGNFWKRNNGAIKDIKELEKLKK